MRLCGRVGWAVFAGWLWLILAPGVVVWALDIPTLSSHVVDVAHVLPPATVEQLNQELRAHEAKTSNQVVVLIIPSLEGEPLFDVSHRVATTWKLGQKGTDNGALLLVAIKDRKVRLEVGYGLEGVLTDARSAQIIRNEIVPRFRTGEFAAGISAGVRAVLSTIEGTYQAPERPRATSTDGETVGNVLLAVLVGVFIGLLFSRTHRLLGPVVGGGLSFVFAPWLVPALIAGGASLLLVSLLGGMGPPGGSGPGRRNRGFDGTWFSTQQGGWGGGGLGGSFGGGDSFSGGGGDFGGGGASGDW
ncbi:MAG: TPM domain-containing protein [Nitrospira sp.]|nr:TPM domain-containing protein [Nitrospira sp.]